MKNSNDHFDPHPRSVLFLCREKKNVAKKIRKIEPENKKVPVNKCENSAKTTSENFSKILPVKSNCAQCTWGKNEKVRPWNIKVSMKKYKLLHRFI